MMMMMMMLLVKIVLHRQVTRFFIGRLVVGRRAWHQIDAAHAYGHRRGPILETAPLFPPPRTEDRNQARQRSYRLLASWNILTTARSRGRLASLVTSRQLHGSAFSAFTIAEENLWDPLCASGSGYRARCARLSVDFTRFQWISIDR